MPETLAPTATPKQPRARHRTRFFWLCALLCLGVLFLIKYSSLFNPFGETAAPVIPVVTAITHTANIPVYISALGSVTPTYSVTVKTQINGQLLQVFFREGQLVKKGDVLAEIDSRPYQAQLLQYEGQLARDLALLTNARIDLQRYQRLWQQDSVSQQTLATQAALVKQDEGAVQLDQGLLEATKVNLIYCHITAPIDGRIGLRLVDPGNVVQVSDVNGIAVVNMLDPMTVVFSIPEDAIPEVTQQLNAGKLLSVEAYDRQQNKLLAKGVLLTIDNQIDPTTGQVKLKAQFQNAANTLFPSQFVNVKLLVKTLHQVIVVPTAAIQYSSQGPFVYVVNTDYSVSAKPVVVGVTTGEQTTIVSGLATRQYVVVEGTDKLTDHAKIKMAGVPLKMDVAARAVTLRTKIYLAAKEWKGWWNRYYIL